MKEFIIVFGLICIASLLAFWSRVYFSGLSHTYTVESFTDDLTVRVQCSGECDLAAMIAEARQAVKQ